MKTILSLAICLIGAMWAAAAPAQAPHGVTKVENIQWASPKNIPLTMDIYTPDTGKKKYPVIVMFHGGGWLINTKEIMNESAAYLASHGEYVVCNVNYRTLPMSGNTTTINEMVEDVLGAVMWVKDYISTYKGDPKNITVTGDSAGGHLAISVVLLGQRLESDGFAGATFGFKPTYLPKGKTAEQVAKRDGLAVQAAIISYGAFDLHGAASGGFETKDNAFWGFANAEPRGIMGAQYSVQAHPDRYKAVSPIYQIPQATQKTLPPMLFTVGSNDDLTTPESIEAFIAKLKAAGHTQLEYWVHEGRPHAFLDSGENPYLGIRFDRDATPALDKMLTYLDKIFVKKP